MNDYLGYPWPDPTDNEIERLTAERDEARDRVAMLDLEAAVVTTQRDEARAAIARVRDLHARGGGTSKLDWYEFCRACDVTWPCRTIRALAGES